MGELTRDQARSRATGPRRRRLTVVDVRREVRRERRATGALTAEHEPPRPRTRGECVAGPRPCPWVGCRYHLALEARPARRTNDTALVEVWPGVDLWELHETCALDVADRGPHGPTEVARIANVTRETVRVIVQRHRHLLEGSE